MGKTRNNGQRELEGLQKAPTGIGGLDEITQGGFPRGRPTLVCGGAGCGKTLLGIEFLVRGATEYNEPGVFIAFEETPEELTRNVASLGFDLKALERRKKLFIDYVHIERSEIEETGEYDLEGLFVRLNYAIESIGAKRIVLDTLETLFGGFSNFGILRSELRRLFRWLKEKGVTAVITAERGEGTLTRQGLEEYVSDCVILLDHRVHDQLTTRRLRVVKYRGSQHGTNEYPFLIDKKGISVTPITSIGLQHTVSTKRISTGVAELDAMLDGGYYVGSSTLVSGTAGTGKTSLAVHLADAACSRGERVLFFASEESPHQIQRNASSIGINLKRWVDRGLLQFHAERVTSHGLETHLAQIHRHVNAMEPQVVVFDPLNNLLHGGGGVEVRSIILRIVDFLKAQGITGFFTSIADRDLITEHTDVAISSLVDTWLLVRNIEQRGERNRGLYVLKSRGTAHSNQIREFVITNNGIKLVNVCVGEEGILIGSARDEYERDEAAVAEELRRESERKHYVIEQRRKALEAKIQAMRSEFEAEVRENEKEIEETKSRVEAERSVRAATARQRQNHLAAAGRRTKNGSRRI